VNEVQIVAGCAGVVLTFMVSTQWRHLTTSGRVVAVFVAGLSALLLHAGIT
jgi:hypothetical protein